MKRLLAATSLLALATTAQAEFPVGKVGFNLAPRADIEINSGVGDVDGDGDGLGFYGELGSDAIFGYADLQMTSLDVESVDVDVDETRFGIGLRTGAGNGNLVARLEHYDVNLDMGAMEADDDGFGVHIGGDLPLGNSGASLFGSIGMLSLDDLDGNEYRVGVSAKVADNAQLYGLYRMASLEDDDDGDIDLSDFRIGLNLLF